MLAQTQEVSVNQIDKDREVLWGRENEEKVSTDNELVTYSTKSAMSLAASDTPSTTMFKVGCFKIASSICSNDLRKSSKRRARAK